MGRRQLFLSGHGAWHPQFGFTRVPPGCTMNFYTSFAKTMNPGHEMEVLMGDSKSEPERTVEGNGACPDFMLTSQPADWIVDARDALAIRKDPNCFLYTTAEKKLLSTFFKTWMKHNLGQADFHWMACQEIVMKDAGGTKHGVNARDLSFSSPRTYGITLTDQTIQLIKG